MSLDRIHIVEYEVNLDSGHIEGFTIDSGARLFACLDATLCSSSCFSREFFHSVPGTSHACKVSQCLAKSNTCLLEHLQGCVGVQTELGVGVPSSKREQ
jgi:hypothetical protein